MDEVLTAIENHWVTCLFIAFVLAALIAEARGK